MGIGGVGMCGLAEVALGSGAEVSGCDLAASERTDRLRALGIEVHLGHATDHLEDVDTVVYSAAVAAGEPELEEARRRGINVVRRAVMLGELMDAHFGVAVAGTHGKTTTTAMIGHVLTENGLDPTVLVGGHARFAGSNARIGAGEILVSEADEFDRAFLELRPAVAVVTNLEPEHLDCYGSASELEGAFLRFCSQTRSDGAVVLCRDDDGAWGLSAAVAGRVIGYGLSAPAALRAEEVETRPDGSTFNVIRDGYPIGSVRIRLPGRFNIRNTLAALAVGLELGRPFADLAAACSTFSGVRRRFDVLGTRNGITVVDDYAHHPTEINAVLEAARQSYPGRRLVVVFQPHLYSRTRDFAERFAEALLGAEAVVVLPVYAAREAPVDGVDESLIVNAATRLGHPSVTTGPGPTEAPEFVDRLLAEGDVLVTMGAGDVHRVAEAWLRGAA
jgi:UDP-N-acetylmuramate--alanine ligase